LKQALRKADAGSVDAENAHGRGIRDRHFPDQTQHGVRAGRHDEAFGQPGPRFAAERQRDVTLKTAEPVGASSKGAHDTGQALDEAPPGT
jgi:hypothetical protein